MNQETLNWNGQTLLNVMSMLYPIMRSIAGPGVRESLKILQAIAPIDICEVTSGDKVLDWTVPD